MGLFEKILVPVDGSRYSLNAVRWAIRLAGIHQSRVRLLHVLDVMAVDHLVSFCKKKRESICEELRNSAQGFLKDMEEEAIRAAIALEIVIKEGVPHEVILQESSSWGADLIVIGKLGRRGVSHILLGSVAERVIDFSEVPVLAVK
jgi:nucleotide-binding universal stress UspA family protein